MTIQQVIMSGKKFRRKAFQSKVWWEVCGYKNSHIGYKDGDEYHYINIEVPDVLATDWEIKP